MPRSPSQQAASDAMPTEGYQPSLDDDDGGMEEMMKILEKEQSEKLRVPHQVELQVLKSW